MKAYTQNTLFFIISLFLISCSDKNVNQDSEVKSHEDLEKELQIRSEEKEAYFKQILH